MNEIVKILLENFVNKEIDDVLSHIKVSEFLCNKINDKRAIQTQLDSLFLYNEYLTALKTLRNRIEREDL